MAFATRLQKFSLVWVELRVYQPTTRVARFRFSPHPSQAACSPCSKSRAVRAEAEWDKHILLSFADSLRLPAQDTLKEHKTTTPKASLFHANGWKAWGSDLALLQAFYPFAKASGMEKPEGAKTAPKASLLSSGAAHALVSLPLTRPCSPRPQAGCQAAKVRDHWFRSIRFLLRYISDMMKVNGGQ